MKPKISIIIPTLNSPASLENLLKSLTSQLIASHTEVIVVHNLFKSFDKNKYNNFESYFFKFHYACSGQEGVNFARNEGLRQASAEIVWFLDDDCFVQDPQLLNKAIDLHQTFSEVAGIGGHYISFDKKNSITHVYNLIADFWLTNSVNDKNEQTQLIGGNATYKMRDVAHLKFDNNIIFGGSEESFNQQIVKNGNKLILSEELGVEHRNSINLRNFLFKSYLQGSGYYKNYFDRKNQMKPFKGSKVLEFSSLREEILFEGYKFFFYFGRINGSNKKKLHFLTVYSFFYAVSLYLFNFLYYNYFSNYIKNNIWKMKIPLYKIYFMFKYHRETYFVPFIKKLRFRRHF